LVAGGVGWGFLRRAVGGRTPGRGPGPLVWSDEFNRHYRRSHEVDVATSPAVLGRRRQHPPTPRASAGGCSPSRPGPDPATGKELQRRHGDAGQLPPDLRLLRGAGPLPQLAGDVVGVLDDVPDGRSPDRRPDERRPSKWTSSSTAPNRRRQCQTSPTATNHRPPLGRLRARASKAPATSRAGRRPEPNDVWHTYGPALEAGRLPVLYYDDQLMWYQDDARSRRRSEYLLLSSEVQNGSWAGNIPTGGYGLGGRERKPNMQVDYVRAYAPGPRARQFHGSIVRGGPPHGAGAGARM